MEILLAQAAEIDAQISNIHSISPMNNLFPIEKLESQMNDLEIETISIDDINTEYEKAFESLQIQTEALVQVLVNMGFERVKLTPVERTKKAKEIIPKRISSYSDSMVEESIVNQEDNDENDLDQQELPNQTMEILDDEIVRSESPTFQLSTLSLQLLADNNTPSPMSSQKERDSLDSMTPPMPTLAEKGRESDSLFSTLIKSLTEKEYSCLPLYVTSQVTISYLNDVVAEINDLLTDKRFMDSEDVDCFTFGQLQEASKLSSARLKAALLELQRVSAVEKTRNSNSWESKEYRIK